MAPGQAEGEEKMLVNRDVNVTESGPAASRRVDTFLLARAAALALVLVGATRAGASAPEEHVRGVIRTVAGDVVTVQSTDGHEQRLKLGDKTRVSVATKADLAAIAKNEVHVFPEAMRGAGEGYRPWDLEPGSAMTDASVAGVEATRSGAASTMTNANVADVSEAGGSERLKLVYAGGEKTVLVPAGTPVVRLQLADRSALAVQRHVFAAGSRQPDGTVLADRMVVGKDGVVPPM
jgi:hypothetical protein